MPSRYVIGIDLGTSNSAISYLDTLDEAARTEVLPIPQRESERTVTQAATLPSFLYLSPEGEKVAGNFARAQTGVLPGRVVTSAKSWLTNPNVDREEKILPWASEDVTSGERLSPVEVSASYLAHLRETWDESIGKLHPDYAFAKQDVTVTVPASFDESAQALTLAAARAAGFQAGVRLLEEPQAAFYFWLESRAAEGRLLPILLETLSELKDRPQTVLVCDIGGGTTDFSLFEILAPTARQRIPRINRIAVSDHILLGGDNIDLAIAKKLEAGIGKKLSARQWNLLAFLSRGLKERVLAGSGDPNEVFHVSLPSDGAGLFGKAITGEIRRGEVRSLVLDGFFPPCDRDDRPAKSQPGLREWGLPFASDSRVTRHLAAFLNGREVDAVLFTGGTLKPEFLRARLSEEIAKWQRGREPALLENPEMDLAVARGAAYYGAVLRKPQARIRGGYPHAVFLELYREDPKEAPRLVCVLPKGFEAGDKLKIKDVAFKLLVGRPVRFQVYYANAREGDAAGDVVRLTDEFQALPPLQTELTLKPGMPRPKDGQLDITVEATVSETGLLQLACVHGRERWQLDFNLRKAQASQGDAKVAAEDAADTGVTPERLQAALDRILLFYGKKKSEVEGSPKNLVRELEKILGREQDDWNLALLRSLWPALQAGGRGRSPAHEITWLRLAGFVLRPGYGADLDPWRVAELWKAFPQGPAFPAHPGTLTQWWILWRRVAGGLDAPKQQAILDKILTPIRNRNDVPAEVILLAGSLERLGHDKKKLLGDHLARQVARHKVTTMEQHLWTLGRLASRTPLYAGAQAALPPGMIVPWLDSLLAVDLSAYRNASLFLSQAARLTGDRLLDVPAEQRARALSAMEKLGATEAQKRVVRELVPVDAASQALVFGEELPAGLKLAAPGDRAA